jgi:hypothetical protein
MSDLLKDVDDMMRQERLRTIWLQYGNYIIGAILTLILVVALNAGYQAWFKATSERHTAAFMATLNQDDAAAFERFGKEYAGKNIGALASIMAAQKQFTINPKQSIDILLTVRNDSRVTPDLRNFATLMWGRAVANDPNHKAVDIREALKPLMRDINEPFYALAVLESASIMAHREGNRIGAIELLKPIATNAALPHTLSARARAMMDVYRVNQNNKPEEKTTSLKKESIK